uniref:Uncharacterized protein n=1 Tax=Nelumbo nucifera TaxID=4432 RepID=A0A822ZLH5_NELNU|nr:TPA_asm: hypothetical protein HUJ06_003833 [Nelumbo nucifera]
MRIVSLWSSHPFPVSNYDLKPELEKYFGEGSACIIEACWLSKKLSGFKLQLSKIKNKIKKNKKGKNDIPLPSSIYVFELRLFF